MFPSSCAVKGVSRRQLKGRTPDKRSQGRRLYYLCVILLWLFDRLHYSYFSPCITTYCLNYFHLSVSYFIPCIPLISSGAFYRLHHFCFPLPSFLYCSHHFSLSLSLDIVYNAFMFLFFFLSLFIVCITFFLLFVSLWSGSVACKTAYLIRSGRT